MIQFYGAPASSESIAINFYLAETYAPSLWADSTAERAQIYAWSLCTVPRMIPDLRA